MCGGGVECMRRELEDEQEGDNGSFNNPKSHIHEPTRLGQESKEPFAADWPQSDLCPR